MNNGAQGYVQETEELLSTEFQPLSEFLLVKPKKLETEVKSEFGIVIENKRSVVDRPCSGEVLAIGKKASDETDVQVGHHVIWVSTKGIDLKFKDGIFILLDYQSLIGYKKV